MNNKPLISFCIATYKRPDFLYATVKSILAQGYSNIEIVVADNDPRHSAKKTIEAFKSSNIIYVPQKKNVGMMKNFRTAFDHSKGDFIVFTSDDDPLESNMVTDLIKIYRKFPNAGSYFGAPYVYAFEPEVLEIHKLKRGKNSMRNIRKKRGLITKYSPSEFIAAFLKHEIFGYFLWSCGMVKRDVVIKSKGPLDFNGVNYLTDFSYILRVGSLSDTVIINKELGGQTIHGENYGRSDIDLLKLNIAAKGFYKHVKKLCRDHKSEKYLENFLKTWVKSQILGVLSFRKETRQAYDLKFFIDLYKDIARELNFFKNDLLSFYFYIYFPNAAQIYDNYKWLFEKRTVIRAFEKIFLGR